MKLIIVESPTKAKTIQRFLSGDFIIKSSYGHIRDLPKKKLGIDIENDFQPQYVVPLKNKKNLAIIKNALKKASTLILATDEDREGESIAWHIVQALGLQDLKTSNQKYNISNIERIVFHEITKQAIEEALKNPRDINMDLVNAQQARRILDRLVGYKLSPFLWHKVARGLSAGRVQSVALRLIVEREREIQKFKPEEYWTIVATLSKMSETENQEAKDKNNEFKATLIKIADKTLEKLAIKNKEEAHKIVSDLEDAVYKIANIEKKEIKKNPLPPFTTSTLQQAAWQKFGFSTKQTMLLAQGLYESGYITYHRTDSLNLSEQSLRTAKKFIEENFGKNYWAGFLRKYKTKIKGAQEAHEAIRPTEPLKIPAELSKRLEKNQSKLYDLIWRRFIASQMAQVVFDSSVIDIDAKPTLSKTYNPTTSKSISSYTFRAAGSTIRFDGFLKVYPIKFTENELPQLQENEILKLVKLTPTQHFTQPPPRYNEATLVKKLEELGIGRPSTYAPIISTIQERQYVKKNQEKKFIPTEMGFRVNNILVEHFPEIVDYHFTAKMEENLDEIAEGKIKWVPIIRAFYEPFAKQLEEKYKSVEKIKAEEKTERVCPQCGGEVVIRSSRFGKFYACKNFPKCRFTEAITNSTNVVCPQCFEGEIVERKTKKGKMFYSCSRYPQCEFALWHKPTGEKCPKCGSLMIESAKGKIKCLNKECK